MSLYHFGHVCFLLHVLVIAGCSAKRSHVFTAPKALQTGTNSTMCITLFNTLDVGVINVSVTADNELLGNHRQTLPAVPEGQHEITCFQIFLAPTSSYSGKLLLKVDFPEEANYTIEGERRVVFKIVKRDLILVQTDKSLYKPGQLVLFRVLTVNQYLRPLTEQISLIYIKSPDGARLSQWRDVNVMSGLTQLSYRLPEKPTLGQWTIHLKTKNAEGTTTKTTKHFRVDEFVLPKFSVDVSGRSYLLGDDKQAIWKVCATYTYGKPVVGTANVTLTRGFRKRPLASKPSQPATNGCVEFTFTSEELRLGVPDSYLYMIDLTAFFTEYGTGVTYTGQTTTKVHYEPVHFDRTGRDDKFFKPGLPFYDKLKLMKPDESPAPGEKVEFCYKALSGNDEDAISQYSYWAMKKNYTCANRTTDEEGIVEFGVLESNRSVHSIAISARAVNYQETKHPMNRWGYRPTFMQMPFRSYVIQGWSSESGSFLQLSVKPDRKPACGEGFDVTVIFTAPFGNYTMFHQVISNGNIQLSNATSVTFTENSAEELLTGGISLISSNNTGSSSQPTGHFTLTIPASAVANAKVKVLVYMVLNDEVIADGQEYSVEECLPNTVTLRWSAERVHPGASVDLKLAAAPNSFCGIDVVDKSVQLLGTKNRISAKDLLAHLESFIIGPFEGYSHVSDHEYCTEKYGDARDNLPQPTEAPQPASTEVTGNSTELRVMETFHRQFQGHAYWKTLFVDSIKSFDLSSVVVDTDLEVESRLCRLGQYRLRAQPLSSAIGLRAQSVSMAMASNVARPAQAELGGAVPGNSVRTYFPETWLFDLVTIGDSGEVSLPHEAPDTITEWVGGAVCSSEEAGVGISSSASLTTFQEIFIRYTLPYAVKRHEILHLKVSVFNYEKSTLPVRLTLSKSDQFEIQSDPVLVTCVSPDAPEVVTFPVKPVDLGKVNITVKAEVSPDLANNCSLQQPVEIKFSDTVIRPMLVKPEGFLREETKTNFICIEPNNNELTQNTDDAEVTWDLKLPEDTVKGSASAVVSVVGDLLGRGIENIHQLVRLPTGCGEQNMVKFVPNIFVKDYLIATDQLTEELKDKLISHMKTGYTRELEYRHADGSYSAFGSSDKSGSTWLTAFVVRSFSQASKYIEIDQDDITTSVAWLEGQQYLTGCFASVGTVLHKAMKGGVSTSGGHALSAYVTASLLLTKVPLRKETLKNAFKCLNESDSSNIYTIALRAYAYALARRWTEAERDYNMILDQAKRSQGLVYWEAPGFESNKALSVEIASYVVLTSKLLEKSNQIAGDHFSVQMGASRWISKQMNGKGGFHSTQDTVMALAAISRFAADLPRSDVSELHVHVSDGQQLSKTLHVTAGNRLLTQQVPLGREQLPAQLSVAATGTGCALVQYWLTYHVKTAAPSDALSINITSEPNYHGGDCLKHTLGVCVSYMKEGDSNMALVEVEMVSGFIPNKNSLEVLKRNERIGLKRWELNDDTVIFYFDALGAEPLCFHFIVQREQEVENAEPAQATVLDYYQPEFSISTTYKLDTECSRVFVPFGDVIDPLPIEANVEEVPDAATEPVSSTATPPVPPPPPPPAFSTSTEEEEGSPVPPGTPESGTVIEVEEMEVSSGDVPMLGVVDPDILAP